MSMVEQVLLLMPSSYVRKKLKIVCSYHSHLITKSVAGFVSTMPKQASGTKLRSLN